MTIKNLFFELTVSPKTCKKDIVKKLHTTDPADPTYEIMAQNYKLISEAEAATAQSRDKVTTAVISGLSSAALMGLVMYHEDHDKMFTTKAFGLIPKIK